MGPVVDPETGLQYLRARYYDPATAQFLTRDRLEAQTRSPFGYVDNNPLNFADPNGLSKCGFSLGGLVDCAAANGRWIQNNARGEAAQTVKDVATGVGYAAAAVSAVSGAVAAGCAAAAGPTGGASLACTAVALRINRAAFGISIAAQLISTGIECADGGGAADCLAGIAAVGLGAVGQSAATAYFKGPLAALFGGCIDLASAAAQRINELLDR